MAIPSKWAIHQIFDIYLFDLATGKNLGYLTDLKQASFTQEAETVYVTGGKGNPKLVPFDHSKVAKIECQSALYENEFAGTILGSTPVAAASTSIMIPEVVTVTSNVATTTYTATGDTNDEIKFAYVRNSDGSLGTAITQAEVASSGYFTYTPGTKTLAFNSGDYEDDTEIVVFYNPTTASDTVTITSYTDQFSESVKVVAAGLARDTCTNLDYAIQIIFYQGKITNGFNLELTADGEPAVHNFSVEALKSCSSKKLFDIIIYDENTLV